MVKIQQVQNSAYNYTVQLMITPSDGTATPTIINSVLADSSGNFSSVLASALQYGDSLSALTIAQSKTTSHYIQSLPLNANGRFQFSDLPMFNGGEIVSLSV